MTNLIGYWTLSDDNSLVNGKRCAMSQWNSHLSNVKIPTLWMVIGSQLRNNIFYLRRTELQPLHCTYLLIFVTHWGNYFTGMVYFRSLVGTWSTINIPGEHVRGHQMSIVNNIFVIHCWRIIHSILSCKAMLIKKRFLILSCDAADHFWVDHTGADKKGSFGKN